MIDAKCSKCRRAGEKLFLKGERCFGPKCSIAKDAGAPGMHGAKKRRGRGGSEYGTQLREKQKVKQSYGIRERQFRKYFDAASKSRGRTSGILTQLLETRLDNVVFRLGFAGSRSQARQMVGHGHFAVNGRRVDIPSYQVKTGDIITIREGSAGKKIFNDLRTVIKKYDAPEWLAIDKEALKGEVKRTPTEEESEMPFNLQLIIEFYSR
ncbi:30S ribosomal protein S4 [Candidatus Azambacteria bacterium RBG_16_47_10]|uniref:Small ribosomal subunit protein uS4 n=1 Tax=Candidatus Azambacteria bacterium RBG_16_47_10 TaxID=1797292 RepID=A0A1F5AZR6_9BACT|nr:MAG: 30S ribosomal protein S4 [Candidatus Azambacteria bacterium RBG_16_47_10]